MVPLTRGSIRKLRFSSWPIAVATASISALTKLSVTGSSAARAIPGSAATAISTDASRHRTAGTTLPWCSARRIAPGLAG